MTGTGVGGGVEYFIIGRVFPRLMAWSLQLELLFLKIVENKIKNLIIVIIKKILGRIYKPFFLSDFSVLYECIWFIGTP